MAKILVADDNSNVQKTVALALADLSVDVVAVNNGEAAVRRLGDIAPDLILADIFMPVRNGYEVCEFVKKDARFSHVPVVLLVGAFDPLDEREAQRVGADGILKKPFVPPDPLISMVKALLDRALGERLVAVGAPKPVAVMQQGQQGQQGPQGKSGGVTAVEERPPAPAAAAPPPEPAQEVPVEEFPAPAHNVSFGEGERPIAFGQLLETPAEEFAAPVAQEPEVMEPVDDSEVLTGSRDVSLGEPIFWKTEDPEPESEEENAEAEQDGPSEAPMRAWTPETSKAAQADLDVLEPAQSFELVREEQEAGQASSVVDAGPLIAQDAASQASLTVKSGQAEDLAANPTEWMASVPPPVEEQPEAAADWSATVSEAEDAIGGNEIDHAELAAAPIEFEPPAPSAPAPVASSGPAVAPPPLNIPSLAASGDQPQAKNTGATSDPHKTHPSLKPLEQQSVTDTARSVPKQEWADLAATLLQKPGEPEVGKSKFAMPSQQPAPAAPSANAKPASPSATQSLTPVAANSGSAADSSSAPTNSIPAATANVDLPASNPASPTSANAGTPSGNSAPANSALPPTPDPALVEAVVQRVLDKMRPQVVDIITKEFLRPVVQALVHREITKR